MPEWSESMRAMNIRTTSLPLFLLAIPLIWLALWLSPVKSAPFEITTPPPAPLPAHLRYLKRAATLMAVLGILLLIEINGGFIGLRVNMFSHHGQFAILLACVPMLVWGLSDRAINISKVRLTPASARELAFVIGVTLFSLVIRLHDLEMPRTFIDEINFLVPVFRFTEEFDIRLLQPFSSYIAFPIIYPYFQSLSMEHVAVGLTALRLPAAIIGGLGVPALYFLARELYGKPVAFTSAILIATLPVHLQWSRLGMNNIADSLFAILTFALLIRGVRRSGSWHFALAGVCFGFTQYFYEGGRLFFPILTAVWLIYMRVFIWRALPTRQLVIFLFAAALFALPIYSTLYAMNYSPAIRYEDSRWDISDLQDDFSALAGRAVIKVRDVVMEIVAWPESVDYYAGHFPYIQIYLAPFLILGLGVVTWRWRTVGGSLLLLWIGGMALAVGLVMNVVSSARLLNIFPALMLVSALGITESARLLTRHSPRITATLVVPLALGIGLLHTHYYFGIHIEGVTRKIYAQMPEQELVFHHILSPPYMKGHFITTREVRLWDLDIEARSYDRTYQLQTPRIEELEDYIAHIPHSMMNVFYLVDGDTIALHLLSQRFALRGPLYLENRFAPPDHTFVAYFASADLQAK